MSIDRRTLLKTAAATLALGVARPAVTAEGGAPPSLFVLLHSPGKKWVAGTPFPEQPNVMLHVEYMGKLLAEGVLVVGGPFLDHTGGMAVLQAVDLPRAIELAGADPSIAAGLLEVQVKPWLMAMSSPVHQPK